MDAVSIHARAALLRLGKTGESGCLSVIDGTETVLIFTGQGMILNIYKDGIEAPDLDLDEVLAAATAHLWIADAKPPKIGMAVEIASLASRPSRRPGTRLAKTAKLAGSPGTGALHKKEKVPVFYLLAAEGPRKKISIDRPTIVIGRDKGSDIVLSDRSVSRRHCILQLMVRGLFFRDLASSNGVYVNGAFAREGFLIAGDRLALGRFTFEVYAEDKTKKIPQLSAA